MTDLIWLAVPVVGLTFWAYRHWPVRAKDHGRISARWLQEHRDTREH